MSEHLPEHSPLGASSAERWMNCPGSNVILKQLDLPESDEEDWRKEGVAAHEFAAHCLRNNLDTWEGIGQEFHGVKVDDDMARHVQVYLDYVRELRARPGHLLSMVETRISGGFSKRFYGTVDDAELGEMVLDVVDFKYGEGILVDVKDNPQLKYYGVGILDKHMGPKIVRLHIIQPRHKLWDENDCVFETTTEELAKWRDDELIPAMLRAEIDTTLLPGEWCRFCPAKLACPLLTALFGASVKADASALPNFSSDVLARNLALVEPAKIYLRALEKEAYERMNKGDKVPGFKLVPKKANRVLTNEGLLEAPNVFTFDELYTAPEIKSPAELERVGPKAKDFVKRYAYTPQTGLTVAPDSDRRAGVKVLTPDQAFAHIAAPE